MKFTKYEITKLKEICHYTQIIDDLFYEMEQKRLDNPFITVEGSIFHYIGSNINSIQELIFDLLENQD